MTGLLRASPLLLAPVLLAGIPAHAQCQLQKLVPTSAAGGDQVGDAVALSGEWLIAGASRDDDLGSSSGSASVWERVGAEWVHHGTLLAFGAGVGANDLFGWSVDVDAYAAAGPVAVVGAYLADVAGDNAGAVFVYRFAGGDWIEEEVLVADDAAVGDQFGESVAVSDDLIVVGAALADASATNGGAAYVFRFDGSGWVQEAKLVGGVTAGNDWFGSSVAIDRDALGGPVAVVGAPLHDALGLDNAGAVHVFRGAADGPGWAWSEEQVLVAVDAAAGDKFGEAVDVRGDVLVASVHLDDDGAANAGSVRVLRHDGVAWSEEAVLLAADAAADDQFGRALALASDGAAVLVGVSLDDDAGSGSGSAWLFIDDGVAWMEAGKLTATDAAASDAFGSAVALEGETLVVGANKDDHPGATNAGSIYVFTADDSVCTDCDGDLVADAVQIAADPSLDCNGNGVIDACEIPADGPAPGGPYHCTEGCDPDCNANGVPDECDLASGASADCDGDGVPDECQLDCNGNGVGDACDIASGASLDLDGNGVPDECEDCNANGAPDAIDLDKGTSADCDQNGVPDECDVDGGAAPDCNANGVPDSCDVADGTSGDCDADGVPDECADCNGNGRADACDVADGTSTDLNGNGVPDECEDCDGDGVPDFIELFYDLDDDCNENGVIDSCEIPADGPAPGVFHCVEGCDPDCNANGVPDACDIGSTSSDDDGNGVPDECEDCNGNGEPDSLDVSGGASDDCNQNGVPDECEIPEDSPAPGGPWHCTDGCAADCNANGVPDACDIAQGLNDCDQNGVPDVCDDDCNGNGLADGCDIAAGTSPDWNGNGIPDECEPDCDADGVPDFIEILFELELDCNENGVPDDCDLDPSDPDGDGTSSADANANGVPDECEQWTSPADLDGSGVVDFQDLLILLSAWGGCPSPPSTCPADLDANGLVDFADLLALLSAW